LAARAGLMSLLGPGIGIEVGDDEIIVTIRPDVLAKPDKGRFRSRMKAVGKNTKIIPDRPDHYGLEARPSYRANDPDRSTICLVHGLNSTADSFVNLIPALESQGFGVVTFNYDYDRGLEDASKEFRREWMQFRRDRGDRRPWAILSHSMGALVGRMYVEGDDYAGDVSDLLMIAPSNQGAAVAKAQRLLSIVAPADRPGQPPTPAMLGGKVVADLVPGSAFLHELNARPRREGVGYHILAGNVGFVTKEARDAIEGRIAASASVSGLIGGLSRWAGGDLAAALDEMSTGTGDGCVSVASTRLDGVKDHEILPCNHVELIRGPLLYPDPGPVACLPWVLKRLPPGKSTAGR
jgi:pimeloyl-ACP methyl ester carboxylesterase